MATFLGVWRFSFDAEFMMKRRPGTIVQICWQLVCPFLLGVICVSSLVTYKPLKMGDYTYPPWAQVFAIAATLVPIGIIFLGIVLNFHESGYNCQKALRPSRDWGPKNPDLMIKYRQFLIGNGITPPGTDVEVAAAQELARQNEALVVKPDDAVVAKPDDAPAPGVA